MITSFFKPKPTSGDDVEAEATGEAAATSASAQRHVTACAPHAARVRAHT